MAIQNMCISCGTNISMKGKRCKSCAGKHRWTNPEIRKRMSVSIKRGHNTLEYRAAMIARWKDPAFKKKVSVKIKLAHNTPEFKEKMRAQWADPDSNIRRATSSSEFRAKHSANMKAQWSVPRRRRKYLEGFAKRLRRDASVPELRVKVFLDANFAGVIHQYVPDEEMSPGIFDFYIPSIDTLMEVDDDIYWHTLENVWKNDLKKEKWALEHEYGFVRITEGQAKSSKYLLSLLKELLQEVT